MTPWLALFLALAVWSPDHGATGSEAEIQDAISRFGQAFAAADTAALSNLLTNTYVHINGRSGTVLDRTTWLAWVGTQRARLQDGSLRIRTYQVSDLSIILHGTAAVATGTVLTEGERDGSAFSSLIRFTNVWVRQDGSWRRAAFHDSPITGDE